MSKYIELLHRIAEGDNRGDFFISNELLKEIQELLAQPEPEPSVKLPESEDESVMMNLLSDNWLRHHAPHRLNQPEQNPVAWITEWVQRYRHNDTPIMDRAVSFTKGDAPAVPNPNYTPLYTAPPKREPLSDEAIADLWWNNYVGTADSVRNFARAIEKAHGIGGGE